MPELIYPNPVNLQAPLNRGLVSWWMSTPTKQGLGGFQIKDLTGRYDATLASSFDPSVVWAGPRGRPGGFGSNLWGTDSATASGTKLEITTAYTLSVWFYPTGWGVSDVGRMFDYNFNAYILAVHGTGSGLDDNNLIFYNGTTFLQTPANSLSLNNWQHGIATYDGTTLNMYINGVLSFTDVGSHTLSAGAGPLALGAQTVGNLSFEGYLDDWQIRDRGMTALEARALYKESISGYPTTLNWWQDFVGKVPAAPAIGGGVGMIGAGGGMIGSGGMVGAGGGMIGVA